MILLLLEAIAVYSIFIDRGILADLSEGRVLRWETPTSLYYISLSGKMRSYLPDTQG